MENTLDLKNRMEQKNNNIHPALQFTWRAREFTARERGREWFWGIGIIGAGASVFSLIIGNFLFSIIIILVISILFMYEVRGPREYEFGISAQGILAHDRLFEFFYLDSFWIFEHENGERELSVLSQKIFIPHIKIPLGTADAKEVSAVLKKYLPEKHQEESFTDVLARRFKL